MARQVRRRYERYQNPDNGDLRGVGLEVRELQHDGTGLVRQVHLGISLGRRAVTHAVLKIDTPFVSVRVNVGINHQGRGEKDWDGRVLPDLDVWQINMRLESLDFADALSGILWETARPELDKSSNPIMTGMEAIRATVEVYRVSGALGVDFHLVHQTRGV